MEEIFSPLTPLKVTDEVIRHIKALITGGTLQPGQKFPAERTMANMLGIGRSTLREAMQSMAILGFVEIKQRKGTFVRSVGAAIIPDPFSQIMNEDHTRVKDLYELRKDLEVAASYVAARKRGLEDLAEMEKHLLELERQVNAPRLGLKADIAFHLAIARATDNVLRVHVLENLFDRFGHYIDIARRPILEKEAHNAIICTHHRDIFESIKRQQPGNARRAMHKHLSWVEAKWEQAMDSDHAPK